MQPDVPGFGGTTSIGANRAPAFALIVKVPLLERWTCAVLIGPFAPIESRYLNPVPTACHPEAGRENDWVVGEPPCVEIVSVAPATVGSPTTASLLSDSF